MRSIPAFLAVAVAVTLTPGPAFALLLQIASRDGRRAALANIIGNSAGVLVWGALSAVGVSALLTADQLAYQALRILGAGYLLWLGVRALLSHGTGTAAESGRRDLPARRTDQSRRAWQAARKGLVNSLANPKLAGFFIALFPQFLIPGTAVLPAAMAMAAVIVAFDVLWYGSVAVLVDRYRSLVRARVMHRLEQAGGAVLVAFGLRLAAEAR